MYRSYYDSVYMEDAPRYFDQSQRSRQSIDGCLEAIFKSNPTAEMTDLELAKATGHAYSRAEVRVLLRRAECVFTDN